MSLSSINHFLPPRVLISSCDDYSDLWEPLLQSYNKFWPDCPWKVNILTDSSRHYGYDCVITSLKDNLPWSSVLINCLENIEEEAVLLTLDDFFLKKRIDTYKLLNLYNSFCSDEVDVLRLVPRPSPKIKKRNSSFSIIGSSEPYRVSTQASFWKVPVLLEILKDGENPWEFEINGSKRSQQYNFYGCHKSIFNYYHHDVQRGKWFPWSLVFLKYHQFKIDSRRKVMNPFEVASFSVRKIAMKFLKLWRVIF